MASQGERTGTPSDKEGSSYDPQGGSQVQGFQGTVRAEDT